MLKVTAASHNLLEQAAAYYDDPRYPFEQAARDDGWRTGFVSGAEWMRLAMETLRGEPVPRVKAPFQRIGIIKYGLCSLGALACLAAAWYTQLWWVIFAVPFAFYGIEAQMVFLFPAVLDGTPEPFRASRRWTVQAGGTLRVMSAVMPIAAVMLFGGFFGQGFLRSWALGCLAIVIWYERLRRERVETVEHAERVTHAA